MSARLTLSIAALTLWSCGGGSPVPPEECAAAWEAEPAAAFVNALVAATASDRPVWGAYGLDDGSYVLNAGESDQGNQCVGLWQSGEAVAYAALSEEPKLLTPLYGYYFAASADADSGLVAAALQPRTVREWLESFGVDRAVVMPVDVPDFPITLTPLFKTQLAVHEGFHVAVQMPRWYDATGPWPEWDRQPDRSGVQACYAASAEPLQEERESLVLLIDALLDSDRAGACSAGREFLERRSTRYESLADLSVTMYDGTPGSCARAEALLELEEGTADYASWSVLYDLGQAPREDLIKRYRAQQDEIFYLTGAMQLHAVELMDPDAMAEVARAIGEAEGIEDGSLTAVFRRTLGGFCR